MHRVGGPQVHQVKDRDTDQQGAAVLGPEVQSLNYERLTLGERPVRDRNQAIGNVYLLAAQIVKRKQERQCDGCHGHLPSHRNYKSRPGCAPWLAIGSGIYWQPSAFTCST